MFFEVVESMCVIGWKPVCGIGIMQGVLSSKGFEGLAGGRSYCLRVAKMGLEFVAQEWQEPTGITEGES